MSDYFKDGCERTYDHTLNGETIYREVGTGDEYYEDSFGNLNSINEYTSPYETSDDYYEKDSGTSDEMPENSNESIPPENTGRSSQDYINGTKYARVIDIPSSTFQKKNNASQESKDMANGFVTLLIIGSIIWLIRRIF